MSSNKRNTPVKSNGATKAVVNTAAPAASTNNGAVALIVHANAPAATGPALGSSSAAAASTGTSANGTGSPPVGSVLASFGVTNKGFTQVDAKNLINSKFEAKLNERLNGMESYVPADTSLLLAGQTFTAGVIVSVLQAVAGLFAAKDSAQAQAKSMVSSAVAALTAELPTANQFLTALDTALLGMFGKGNPVLENFGLSKGTAKKPTVTEKAQAVGTMKLTRISRKTMGKVQKAKVKGGTATLALTGPNGEVLAGSPPASPAAPATPAPAAGSGSSSGNNAGQ